MSVYPAAPRLDLVEQLHGHDIADPYRWLEDGESDETLAWCAAQDRLWETHRDRLGGVDRIRARLQELTVGGISAPVVRGDRSFFTRLLPGEDLMKLIVSVPGGAERILLDPESLSDDHSVVLDSWVPSIEGDGLAYKLSEGGDEDSSLFVMEVATGMILEGPIDRVSGGSLAWLPGGEQYYYVRRLPPDQVPEGEEALHRRIYLHTVGTDPSQDAVVFGEGRDKITRYSAKVSPDGRWLLVTTLTGPGRSDLFIADVARAGSFIAIHEGVAAASAGDFQDGLLYLLTTLDAPRRRIVVCDPEDPTPQHWRELVAEDASVITSFETTDDAIVVARSRDIVSEVTVHDRVSGNVRAQVALPGIGRADLTSRAGGGTDVWIGYTDFVTPYEIWHHDTAHNTTRLWARPPGAAPATDIVTEQVFYSSKDGTQIPMFIVHRADVVLDGSNPTILIGYGGFNRALLPTYSQTRQTWVERGGVHAIANIRGGSEYGEEWHRAGMRQNKQNCFDDFIAAAEYLVAARWTSHDRLALEGGSNGGLLVGAVLTRRPDLGRAVVCRAPVLDSIRLQRYGVTRSHLREYGDAEVAEEFEWLRSYSPYHHVIPGTHYPAVLFVQGEADARVHPMHARKMCAALQWASGSGLPVLLRREEKVGHSTRSMSRAIDQAAESTAWMADQLGLNI